MLSELRCNADEELILLADSRLKRERFVQINRPSPFLVMDSWRCAAAAAAVSMDDHHKEQVMMLLPPPLKLSPSLPSICAGCATGGGGEEPRRHRGVAVPVRGAERHQGRYRYGRTPRFLRPIPKCHLSRCVSRTLLLFAARSPACATFCTTSISYRTFPPGSTVNTLIPTHTSRARLR